MEEQQINNDEIEIDLLELVRVLVRKIWIIILCLVIGAGAAGAVTAFAITPQYEASSMIYILSKTTSVTSAMDLQLSKQLTVDFETLGKSRPVIEAVIKDLKLDYTYEEMLDMVTVENPTETSILKMTVQNPDPKLAADISNAMSEATASRIAEVMVTDKPSKVEDAVVPTKPVSPSMKKNILIGGLAAALVAAAVIVVMFLLDDTIKTEEDVKKYLNLNTLAALPIEKKKKNGNAERGDKTAA